MQSTNFLTRAASACGITAALLICALWSSTSRGNEPDWTDYTALLQQHVHAGVIDGIRLSLVDYPGIRRDPRFATAVRQIARFPLQQLSSHEERMAFYINAYNLLAIKMVTDHWPVKSIKDAGSLFTTVWKKPAGTVGGQAVTLNDIEHHILRPMGDPRIHMAIVCASISCPDLRPEAYAAARLNEQLNEQARRFLANPGKGLRIEGGHIRLSRIFDWFSEDFRVYGGVRKFILKFSDHLPTNYEIETDLDYNWSLNYKEKPAS